MAMGVSPVNQRRRLDIRFSGFHAFLMRIKTGNLWDYLTTHKVVITTNIGWHPATLENNMGAGMALQAAMAWPWLPRWYGEFCRATAPETPVVEHPRLPLIFLPVKPLLDPSNPERSWDQTAKLDTIERSLEQLVAHPGKIALAFPGCGNGALSPALVLPILRRFLREDRFVVVDKQAALAA
jgi:hypothetical protein